jgi:GntR family transcriptional regulator
MRQADGAPVQFIKAHYHAERFRYRLLSRREEGAWREGL